MGIGTEKKGRDETAKFSIQEIEKQSLKGISIYKMDSQKKVVYEKCSFDPIIELILQEQKQQKEKKNKKKPKSKQGLRPKETEEVIENSYYLKHETE